jgi:hypothetical protein
MLTYTIDGFNLHQPAAGFKVLESTTFAPQISPNRVNLRIPRMHGQIALWDDELTEAKLRIRVRVTGSNAADLQMRWDHLRRTMGTGRNAGLTIRRESGTATNPTVTSTFAQLETMSEPDFYCPTNMVDTEIIFNIPSGRWESIQSFDYTFTNYSTAQNVPFVAQSTAPHVSLLVRLRGPFTANNAWVRLFDETNNTAIHIRPNTTFTADQWVIYDDQTRRMWLNDTDDFDARQTPLGGAYVTSLESGFLSLVPNPSFQIGQSTSQIRCSRSGSANQVQVTLRGRRSFI